MQIAAKPTKASGRPRLGWLATHCPKVRLQTLLPEQEPYFCTDQCSCRIGNSGCVRWRNFTTSIQRSSYKFASTLRKHWISTSEMLAGRRMRASNRSRRCVRNNFSSCFKRLRWPSQCVSAPLRSFARLCVMCKMPGTVMEFGISAELSGSPSTRPATLSSTRSRISGWMSPGTRQGSISGRQERGARLYVGRLENQTCQKTKGCLHLGSICVWD